MTKYQTKKWLNSRKENENNEENSGGPNTEEAENLKTIEKSTRESK